MNTDSSPRRPSRLRRLPGRLLPSRLRSAGRNPTFEDFDGTWQQALRCSDGYGDPEILARVLAASLSVEDGTAVHERDSVNFDRIHYAWPVLAALMWSAARNSGSLRVIDLGGSLGTTYRQNRRFLERLSDVTWAVVEQASFVAAGREHFADARLQFYESIMDAAAACQPQVGLVSSSLQYLAEPVSALEQLSATGAQTLVLDRTPIHHGSTHRIVLQHVPSNIYPATYPARIFSKSRLITSLKALGWNVLEEFETLERASVTNSGFKFSWFGMILTRTEVTSP